MSYYVITKKPLSKTEMKKRGLYLDGTGFDPNDPVGTYVYYYLPIESRKRKSPKSKSPKRKLHTGPRGGKYYISKGRKIYIK
ncbi:MAG TPA: hypothetical protein VLG50_08330 [Candidatus Saccharimonadales bacterium]|nr:hypothetical protein [Candidatus Saccharimonadales bacterium]